MRGKINGKNKEFYEGAGERVTMGCFVCISCILISC